METGLSRLVKSLLAYIEADGGGDLMGDFLSIIPVKVISHLLGAPHANKAPSGGWALGILGPLEPELSQCQE